MAVLRQTLKTKRGSQIPSLFWENPTSSDEYCTPYLNSSSKTTQPEPPCTAHLISWHTLSPSLNVYFCITKLLFLVPARPARESFLIRQEPSPREKSQLPGRPFWMNSPTTISRQRGQKGVAESLLPLLLLQLFQFKVINTLKWHILGQTALDFYTYVGYTFLLFYRWRQMFLYLLTASTSLWGLSHILYTFSSNMLSSLSLSF